MSNRKEKLNAYKQNLSVIFRDYLKSRKINKQATQFIVEGIDDPKYYTTRFDLFFDLQWNLTSVGGKSKVLGLRQTLEKHPLYKKDKCYYFIDKDYEEKINLEKVYCTPTYSIENLYLDESCIKKLIISECGLSNANIEKRHEIMEYILNDYRHNLNKFHNDKKVIKLNTVFKYIRKNGGENLSLDKVLKIEFEENDLKKLRIRHQPSFLDLKKEKLYDFKNFYKSEENINFLKSPLENFRGKQEIIFLKCYLKRLYSNGDLNSEISTKFGVNIKLENPAMADKLLSNLSSYANTPSCLKSFLLEINHKSSSYKVA
ncbi:DUF4435 domain-containing protein [Acinetobacter lwoffii]|uniref:DUF4435 domain-containing protein n=1 Tax=Acinetobacter lwoffii TaxID=28090 RepID=UPI001FF5F722|nr:DUF4435 domain-containing protein [Acinetobacter lwoffii]MCJ8512666.1 DUF4435 domain-containing protein [Acinetobacter lwoffii]